MAPLVASSKCRLLLLVAIAITSHLAIAQVAAVDPEAGGLFELAEPPGWFENPGLSSNSTNESAEASSGSRASVGRKKNSKGYKCGLAPLNKHSRRGARSVVGPNDQIAAQITNGDDEHYGSWPSFVTLGMYQTSTGLGFACGGTLVTDRHVLTAAHCTSYNGGKTVYKPHELTVKIGDHSKNRVDQYEAKLPVKRVCQAPNYNSGPTMNDWTILELKSPVKFSDHVQPACLAQKMPPTKGSKSVCYLVGGGTTRGDVRKREIKNPSEEDEDEPGESRRASPQSKRRDKSQPKQKNIVQELNVMQSDCSTWGVRASDKSRICFLGVKTGDACAGDSGGPIMCLSAQNRWTIVGVVSYGSTRCDHRPGVYADVHKLLGDMMQSCPSIKGFPMG